MALDSCVMTRLPAKSSSHTDSTIDQVADLAGVSRATVSRVINGSAHVSPERVKAVQRAIRKLNFTPNTTARRLAGGRSGLIALLIEESSEEFFTNSFWGEVVRGFSETIREAGMHPLMLIQPKSGTEESLFATLQAGQMDGLAIFGWHKPVKVLEKLLDPKMAVGSGALSSLTTGVNNTAVGGTNTLSSVSTVPGNTAVGVYALSLCTGQENTCVGYFAGANITTGGNNTCIGRVAYASSATVNNEITFGDSSITALRCQVTSITALSDARDKTNIQPLIPGLNFINRLNPVSFDWNMRDGGKVGIADTGFIAQDLQACQSLTQEFIPGLVYAENPNKLEAAYGKLIPVLVKAIQELTARVAELEGR